MKILLTVIMVVWLCLSTVGFAVNEKDWLNKAYKGSHTAASNPYATDVEADDLFDTSLSLEIGQGGGLKPHDSVLVRITRFMMRMAVILAIPVILYSGIMIIMSLGDEGKMKKTLQQIGVIIGGILLVLLSVMIVFLITSLTRSSLPYFVK